MLIWVWVRERYKLENKKNIEKFLLLPFDFDFDFLFQIHGVHLSLELFYVWVARRSLVGFESAVPFEFGCHFLVPAVTVGLFARVITGNFR